MLSRLVEALELATVPLVRYIIFIHAFISIFLLSLINASILILHLMKNSVYICASRLSFVFNTPVSLFLYSDCSSKRRGCGRELMACLGPPNELIAGVGPGDCLGCNSKSWPSCHATFRNSGSPLHHAEGLGLPQLMTTEEAYKKVFVCILYIAWI